MTTVNLHLAAPTQLSVCLYPLYKAGKLRTQRKNVTGSVAQCLSFPDKSGRKESGKEVSLLTCVWPVAPAATRWSEEANEDLAMVLY